MTRVSTATTALSLRGRSRNMTAGLYRPRTCAPLPRGDVPPRARRPAGTSAVAVAACRTGHGVTPVALRGRTSPRRRIIGSRRARVPARRSRQPREECQRRAHVPVRLQQPGRQARVRGRAVVLRRAPERVHRLRRTGAQGLRLGGRGVQGLRLLPDRQPCRGGTGLVGRLREGGGREVVGGLLVLERPLVVLELLLVGIVVLPVLGLVVGLV